MLKIMPGAIVQIYEIQTPDEARAMIGLGVDHIGSVITSCNDRHDPVVRETVEVVRRMGAVSSLIPLYSDPEAVFDTLDYYRPHIVHFCDRLDDRHGSPVQAALQLQEAVKRQFPGIRIMRSIPIGQRAQANRDAVLALAAKLEPLSDYFLTDTMIIGASGAVDDDQPVAGFVGITGLTCDWSVAGELVARSRIPVILAGGISPENAADGILQVRPFGVDSCTCTNAVDEYGHPIRFKKDPARIEALVSEVRRTEGILLDGKPKPTTGRSAETDKPGI
jgi:phosphoribosylanthranilate isomerase